MTFIVATNVLASRPPERRPTGTPHARAKRALTPCYWFLPSTFTKYFFSFDYSFYENLKKRKLLPGRSPKMVDGI